MMGVAAGLASLCAGCGVMGDFSPIPHDGYTRVVIQAPTRTQSANDFRTSAIALGGIMVYMRSTSTTGFIGGFFLPNEDASEYFLIPNGDYRGAAFAQSDSSWGTPRCGLVTVGGANEFKLNGGVVHLNVTLNQTGCTEAVFQSVTADPSYADGTDFKTLTLTSCNATGLSNVSTYSSTCSSGIGQIQSVKIMYLPYRGTPGSVNITELGTQMETACLSGFGGGQLSTSLHIPVGSSITQGLPIRIKAWDNASCSGGTYARYTFPNGFLSAAPPTPKAEHGLGSDPASFKIFAGSTDFKLFLKDI